MIYFITAREVGRVKIGFSDEPRQRFINIQTGSPVPLALERLCEGGVAEEAALHERFAAHRIRGEWFALAPEIEAHMETLAVPPDRRKTFTAELRAAGLSPAYASMIAIGSREITLPIAISFYRAHGRAIGPMEDAEPHEIAVLEKFIGPWSSQRGAA